ncbi:MAG: DUF4837 family protein [Bacteroidota bacterium]
MQKNIFAILTTGQRTLGILLVVAVALAGCAPEGGIQESFESEKIAFGKINQINVLCDKPLWEGPIGDSLEYYYGAAYPILPQPEPIFDLRHHAMSDLRGDPLRKELRTFIVVGDLSDQYSEAAELIRQHVGAEKIKRSMDDKGYGNSVAKNKWAKGQLIIYLFAEDKQKLVDNITNSYSAVAKRINEANAEMIEETTYFRGANSTLSEELRAVMGVNMRIPSQFKGALNEVDLFWMRRETSETSSNIMVTKVPYTDQSQLTREGLKAIRNKLGKKYVSSSLPDTYMRINDQDLPLLVETTRINGDYALEARGIWDIVNDFMGGPFISYLIYDPAKQELLFIDAFVHAPGKEKRDMMQEMEYILHTANY